MNSVGDRIKELRKSVELTQKDFAKRILVSQSYLSGLENNSEVPTSKLIKLICLEFGVNENWLTDNIGELFDEDYENSKTILADISNSALLKIMNLLSAKSNVEYGYYAYALDAFASVLKYASKINENDKLPFLELISEFAMNFDRAITVIHSLETEETDTRINHTNVVLDNIEKTFNLLVESKKKPMAKEQLARELENLLLP